MSRSAADISAPEKLVADHDLAEFDSGEPALDDWLRRRALANEESGSSRTYVVCVGKRVVGYYSLAVGAVAHVGAPGRVKRKRALATISLTPSSRAAETSTRASR